MITENAEQTSFGQTELLLGFPLSPQQKRLWLLQQTGAAYRAECGVRLRGSLRREILETAVQSVVNRHEILRTSFERKPGMRIPFQHVADFSSPAWRDFDLTGQNVSEQETALDALFSQESQPSSAGTQDSPLCLSLLKISAQENILVASLPALCADSWSLRNLFNEIADQYAGISEGRELFEEPVQYVQFSEWQNELLVEEGAGKGFWSGHNRSAAPFTLPYETRSPASESFTPARLSISSDPGVIARINSIGRTHTTKLRSFLLACWQTLLWRLTGEPEIVVLAFFNERKYEEMRGALGLFAQGLPVRANFEKRSRFSQILREAETTIGEALEWQEYFNWERSSAYEGCTAGFEFIEWPSSRETSALSFIYERQSVCLEPLRIRICCVHRDDALVVEFHYNAAYFAAADISRLARQFQTLVESGANNAEAAPNELEILDSAERRQLLDDWNQTRRDYPPYQCVQQMFEAQAQKTPDALALVCEQEFLTYSQLNNRANQLAHYLQGLGVGAETVVALCLERSTEMIVALLGVIKAGGAYLPLEPTHPAQRLTTLLSESQTQFLITEQQFAVNLPHYHGRAKVLCLDVEENLIARESDGNPISGVTPENLLYILFTSGSTGIPKGVAIEHRQLLNYVQSVQERLELPANASYATVSTLSADLGNTMIFPALCSGATLHVVSQEMAADASKMAAYMSEHQIDCLKIVPSHLRALLSGALPEQVLPRQRLVLGGEASSAAWVDQLKRLRPGCRITNHYGPTEATVGVLTYRADTAAPATAVTALPLGRPLPNTQVYVLTEQYQPVPVGIAGELYIGGDGLARGYLNRPELTAERFIPNPFSREFGARLYRTGDLARYLPDGDIEFLGRIDGQVKIRGFRIELGEIETVLCADVDVREALVLAPVDQTSEPRLVAYVVSLAEPEVLIAKLRQDLAGKLPAYMMPSEIVVLRELPLTSNGKVDRSVLPDPRQFRAKPEQHDTPVTEFQELLASIWCDLLRLQQVGLHDSFFDLGGHSLLATQLISRVRETFGVEIALRALFERPTLKDFTAYVEGAFKDGKGLETSPIQRVGREGALALSFAQQRLWFIHQLEPDSAFYNRNSALRLTGPLNVPALEQSLSEIMRRHEVLRTTFAQVDGEPQQVISPPRSFKLSMIDLSELDEANRAMEVKVKVEQEAQRPFDLSQGPLLRAGLLKLSDEEHVMFFTMHHIVSDGWTMALLVRELTQLYVAYCQGQSSPLTELPIQYADFAHWQREWLSGEVLENQLSYWREQLRGAPMQLELPTDRPRTAAQTFKSGTEHLSLSKELSESLKALSRREGVTLFMLLMASFKALLFRYSAQQDIVIGVPVANRNRGEIEGLIGFFLNTLVMRTDLSGNPSFRELLGRVRETTLSAYAYQDLPFEKLVEELHPKRQLGRTPMLQALFIFQNIPKLALNLPELSISNIAVQRETSFFDLTLWMSEEAQGLNAALEYNTDLFDRSTIRRLLDIFQTVLESVCANLDQPVAELRLLSEKQEHQLLTEWNETQQDYPRDQRFHELFEAQAKRTPQAIAASATGQQVSYSELKRRANRLAEVLRKQGVGPDTLVALLMERGIDLLTAIVGIFKAGGAYLPLDPRHPIERIAQVFTRSGSTLIIAADEFVPTLSATLETLPAQQRPTVLSLREIFQSDPDAENHLQAEEASGRELELKHPSSSCEAHNLAYVIYTSGSTGAPKGVMVEQQGMLNHLYVKITDLQLTATDVVAQNASQCFDISVWQMLSPLLVGASVHFFDDDTAYDAEQLLAQVKQQGITILEIVPSLLGAMLEAAPAARSFPQESARLRWLISTGEALSPQLCERWLNLSPSIPMLNAYGPTECSDDVTHHKILEPPRANSLHVPIGRPVGNTRIYLLDQALQPVPVGVQAELFVGGDGVGRGYLDDAATTAQAFVPDPFGAQPGTRLYRTGDLARYLPNGEIEFLGRRDSQVKIRGFRIELGEIEASLRTHPNIRDVVVLAIDEAVGNGNKRLVAYLSGDPETAPSIRELRDFLKKKLPEYMLPSESITLASLPLTASGKIDRLALASIAFDTDAHVTNFVPPRTPLEKKVADIWAQTLRVTHVGVDDDFFELGGHSLLATRVISRIRETLHIELSLRSLFEQPTLGSFAELIAQNQIAQQQTEEAEILRMLEPLSEEEAGVLLKQLSGEAAGLVS